MTAASPLRERVAVVNRADGGVLYWVGKLYGFAAIVIATAIVLASTVTYAYFSARTPPARDLRTYTEVAPAVTRIYAADGTLLGEFAKEWREFTPFDRIPPQLVDAFLAIEDHDYWNHSGIYFKGIARALWANITMADFAQGGSTIEQQVSKQFLGAEKSLSRKAKEAIMARRLEATYSKTAILAVYLNQIYLGAGAYGVAAAARRYFGKELADLTPRRVGADRGARQGADRAPRRRITRRWRSTAATACSTRCWSTSAASAADVAAAKQSPITLHPYRDVFPDRMPYYAEHVRRYLTEKFGNAAVFADGLRVETAAEPTWEAGAYDNADYGARHQDKRQGWRGPEWRVDRRGARHRPGAAGSALWRRTARARQALVPRHRRQGRRGPRRGADRQTPAAAAAARHGVGVEVAGGQRRQRCRHRGGDAGAQARPSSWVTREVRSHAKYREYELPDKVNPSWLPLQRRGRPQVGRGARRRRQARPAAAPADRHLHRRPPHRLRRRDGRRQGRRPLPRCSTARCRRAVSRARPTSRSTTRSRSTTATASTPCSPISRCSSPRAAGATGRWGDFGGTIDDKVTLEYALVFSKNIPSVELFMELKAANVEQWARRLGFTTKIFADEALALGASCSKLDEMARAFTLFARQGAWWPRAHGHDWVYVRRVLDRLGNTVLDNTVAEDPQLAVADRLDRIAKLAGVQPEQAIPPRTAFLMTKLLAHEVEYGFANVLRATDIKAAGKTGTSSATHDNLFIGFTSKFTTLVWMGDDKKQRALGRTDAAYMTVVPLWARYMYEAARGYPNSDIPWKVPPGVKPEDRGDHSKGARGAPMDLIWHKPIKRGDAAPPV